MEDCESDTHDRDATQRTAGDPDAEAPEDVEAPGADPFVLIDAAWIAWFGPSEDGGDKDDPSPLRGGGSSQKATQKRVVVLLFDEPAFASGVSFEADVFVNDAKARSDVPGQDPIGVVVALGGALAKRAVSVQGRIAGRLLLDDGNIVEFDPDGSEAHLKGENLDLNLSCGAQWRDRNRTIRELLARLEQILILSVDREG